jgi:triacylglycerol lipase
MLRNLDCLTATAENLQFPPKKGDYVYFEGPPFLPNAGFHYANAAFAADSSMLAYARYVRTRMNENEFKGILRGAGFTTVETIGDCFVDHGSTARGFFAGNDSFAIVAFRGTEADNPHDILDDADLRPTHELRLGERPAGFVHHGFQSYLTSIWPRLVGLVSSYRVDHRNQEICITGHSLGAAIATLAFHQMADPNLTLYTFGCPRVGDQSFCADLLKTAETRGCYRMVDHLDAVTHVPARFGYDHPNYSLFWIGDDGGITKNPNQPPGDLADVESLGLDFLMGHIRNPIPRSLADHSPVRYCHWLGKKAAE